MFVADLDVEYFVFYQSAGDDESSLTYYTAEGSIMQLPKQDKPRPDSMLSIGTYGIATTLCAVSAFSHCRLFALAPHLSHATYSFIVIPTADLSFCPCSDSVNTLDGVTNPFMEQIPEQGDNFTERSEVVYRQTISTEKPFVHHSEVQVINSSEGGEMELNIETSTSDSDAYTTEWTFNGVPVDSDKMGAYPRIEANVVYLFVPKVSRELHEGRYECTLSWPSGMKALFPFDVTVHEPEADVEPTNEINKLKLKTVEVSKLSVANEEEEVSIEYHEVQINGEQSIGDGLTETVKPILLSVEEPQSRHRASKSSTITIEYELTVNDESLNGTADAFKKQEKISSFEVAKVSGEKTTSTQPLVQEYLQPIKLKVTEGDPFKITVSEHVDSSASIFWTLNGRKIPENVFEIQRRYSAVELTKSTFTESDSGEYTLWVDGKVKVNFLLIIENPKEESKSRDDIEELQKKNEVPERKVEEIVEEKVEKTPEEETSKESPKGSKESSPKDEKMTKEPVQPVILQLSEDDDFKFLASIPLDARQLKSDRLWWTKNGKSFIDVNGVAPRNAKFVSKSSNKSPKSTDVELVKKGAITPEDAATYVLMGEPWVKRGFKNQETVYATIIVSVAEKPKGEPEKLEKQPGISLIQEQETKADSELVKEINEVEKPQEEPAIDEDKSKEKKIRDETDGEKPKSKKSIDASSKEKRRKKSTDEGTEEKSKKKKKSSDETDKEKPKKKKSRDESAEEIPKKMKSISNEAQKLPEEMKEEPKVEEIPQEVIVKEFSPIKEESPKAEIVSATTTAENIIKLKEGDKFELRTSVSLDSKQMKSDRLWWTKNGNPLTDVDGISSRGAKFYSKSIPKSPKSTDIELVKKEPTATEDAATYKLMGESGIKRGFKSQEITYISFVVSVEERSKNYPVVPLENDEKPKPKEAEKHDIEPEIEEQELKEEEMKSKPEVTVEEKSFKPTDEEVKKEEPTSASNTVNLTEGDKFQLTVNVPLDSRQLKSDKLWWTKNGKPFIDVDGIAPRTVKFSSKSTNKSPRTSEVGLIKKDPAVIGDAATYVLIGEPRVKRGFKNQETTYAKIVVTVAEKPKEVPEKVETEVSIVHEEKKKSEPEPIQAVPEMEKPQEEEQLEKDRPRKKGAGNEIFEEEQEKEKRSTDEISEEKPKKKKSIDEKKRSKEEEKKEESQLVDKMPKEEVSADLPDGRKVINLTTGEKLELLTEVPLDTRQLKNEKLWWTKDGKPFIDVDGITSRSAMFTAKSTMKTPKSTDVVLAKKDPAAPEDSATYVLMGEPKIKRDFKSQETSYTIIVLKVEDKKPVEEPEEEKKEPEAIPITEGLNEEVKEVSESSKTEEDVMPEEIGVKERGAKISLPGEEEKKEKRKKKKSLETKDREAKKKSKKKKEGDDMEESREIPSEGVVEPTQEVVAKPIETIELRCIEANANRRLGHDKIPIPAGEPLCLTVTGIPPDVTNVEWTLNGQPVRSGKRVQRLLEPNPLGKRYNGELMAQLYLDSTVLLDFGDYELSIKPTDRCPISANLKIPVDIIPARKDPAKRRARADNQKPDTGPIGEEEDNILQVQPDLCQPLGFAACEGQPLSLIADLNVPPDQVPPESVSWSRNGVPLSRDDPANDFRIKPSDQNHGHTSVILYKPAVTIDDVGFYSVTYNPLPAIQEEPLAEAADEEGYGVAWEVDFPELLVFPAEKPKQAPTPVFTKELPTEIRVSEGDTITLDAEIAEPIPGMAPIWSVNGHDIDPKRTSEYVVWDSGNYFALTIPAVSRYQLGEYKLKLTSEDNTANPPFTSCHVQEKVDFESTQLDSPKRLVKLMSMFDKATSFLQNKLTDMDCYSGDSMELTCRVVGDPIPHFFWRHNGEIVETDDYHRIRTYDNTSTLKIFSVEPKDRGVYICSAVNELGKTQTTANITVDGMAEPYEEFDTDVGKYRPLRRGVPRMAPDGLMIETSTPTGLTICWSPVISEDGSDLKYTVEMSKDKGYFWSPVLTGLQTTRAVLPHTIAPPLQPIQLRVLAENALGTGPPSQPVLKIPARATIPNMTAVKPLITEADLGSVMITWTDPAGSRDGNISYIVEVREGTRSEWKPIATGLKDKAYIHHLKPGVSTMVRIRAYNEFGTSEPSATTIANLPVEHLIPDLAVDPPWVSVIRPDVNFSEKSAHPGLMLHWKEAYLPEYCDDCVRGLKPIYTLEWRRGRTGSWRVIDDCISDRTSFKLPSYIYRAVQDASNYSSQTPEIRVVCRNDYGSTLPTKSLRLTDFGLPKQIDLDTAKPARPEESLFSLPIIAPPQGIEKRPLWLTSMDVEDGISLKWEESLLTPDGSPHGKYRLEYAIMPNSQITDPEGWWKPSGPGSQPILGSSYCLDLPLSATSEQRIRLLALTNDGMASGWLNGYRQVRIPSKRQLLPSAVEGLRARVCQPKDKGGNYSVRLDWSSCGQTEGEQILSDQLEGGLYFQPMETTYRIEVQEGHGVWREIGSVLGSSKTFFEHRTPLSGSTLRYRVIPINRYGEGPEVEAAAVQIPKKLTELQGCVEDLKVLIVAPRSVFLRWRLGDEAIDALESMGRRVPSISDSPSRMGDSGYEDTDWRGAVRYCVERRDGFSSDWYPVATVDSLQDELTGKVTLKNCPKEMYGNEYRVIALLNGQPCAPSRPVRINIKAAELAPDLSYQKARVDVSKVDEYLISYTEEKLEVFFSHHILASTLPQSVEEELVFDVEAMIGNSKEWEKIATGLPTPSFAWSDVNPLVPYSFRIVGRNQFGVGLPSRTTHVDAQVVIPDLSFVVPTVREPTGILEGREPPELKWQTPRVYSLTKTLTPFTYEVQVRPIGGGSSSNDWKVFKEGLKQPKCSLEGLDPTQEYALRVVAVTTFGRGEPSQQTRKRRSRSTRASLSMSNYGSLGSSYDSIPPQFENASPEVIYVPTGGDLDLRCTLASYNLKNPVQFIWSFNFQEIPNLPRYFQHVTGGGKSAQLRLFDLDERDFGTYTCKAVNAYGSAIKEFRVVRADAPVITEVPLPIITLPVHHTLLLPCCVDAVPPAKITWTRDSKRLTSSHRTWIGGETGASGQPDWSSGEDDVELGELTVNASLRVERCVFQDAGLYTMIAENPAGRAQTSCIVRIEEALTPRTITPRWSNIEKHYFVLHKIATGSFSRAHLLIDKKTSREYVGKIYALEDLMTRVLGAREFECLNRLHHNNVVEMVDAIVSDDHLVLVTERLSGNHLLEEVLLGHTWTESAAIMLIKELLEAVAHVHEEGIVHLNIQPDNIIFPRGTSSRSAGLEGLMQALSSLSVDTAGAGGRSDLGVVSCFVKLTGFSMAQPVGQRQGLQMASIMPPALWCPDFAAPELLRVTNATGADEDNSEVYVSFAADVWSMGVIAYLLLFGNHPVVNSADAILKSEDLVSVEDRLSELATSSAEEFERDVSPEAIDFLRHLLATEPCNRPTAKECLRHPWLAEGSHSARNLENSLNSLKSYQRIYQKRKMLPTEKWRRESFLRFADRACIEATPVRRSVTPALLDDPSAKARGDSVQPRRSSIEAGPAERGYSIDRDLTSRITTLMVPPEDRFGGGPGSGASSLRSSVLHLDIEDYQLNQSPLESPSPRLDPWRGVSGSHSPSFLSADDSSEPIKRMCDDISKERDEQILPVEPHLCEGPIKSTNKLAPVFANPLRDSRIDPATNSVFFSCQIANPPRLPAPELYLRGDIRKDLEALGLEGYDLGCAAGGSGVAAAWYLSGCLLSESPGVALGAEPGGWLWLRLDDAERGMAGKIVECVVRARTGKAKTRARILLPEPPNPPGRPGILQSASTEVLVGWSCGNDDSLEDFIYRVDVKYPDAKPIASAWRTVGYTVDRRFLITDLEPDQAYRVRVCVRNAVGWSPYSIASSEFRLHSGQTSKIPLPEEERDWMLQWRQAAHPFGLSDHPEAMSSTATSKAGDKEHEAFKRPPPSGVMKEMVQTGGLFPHLEAIKMLCRTEGLISRGAFGNTSHLMVLLRCHPALVERGSIPNQRPEKQPIGLPAFMVARITRLHDVGPGDPSEAKARQQTLLLTLLRSAAATSASAGQGGASLFTQQFGVRTPSLLPQGLCLGWMANDAAKPTAGVGLSAWAPGGPLLDVLLARGEYTEFSVSRWVHQLLSALRWLHTAFHGRLHGRVDFDNVHAARRTSTLPDVVLTGVEPVEPFEKMAACFTASELDSGDNCNALSDLWSVGVFAYFLLLAESYSTFIPDRQSSRTPTPTGGSADAPETEIPSRRSHKSSVIALQGGYRQLNRPLVNLKAIKQLSKWGRRFVYNTLQAEPMSRGSLDFWLENDWFSLKTDIVKQLTSNTIPSKYVRVFRPTENLYGVVPLFSDETDPLSTV
ncbi:unnamed protein product [Hymenolepis diminuta]|uniref:Ig-like domain-containing protein n=1 Tax=Hymenolepis diminuta TaxID=6216 RepID=A0A0R3S7X3_HYMDI|nr:unnamed protein product [Hymenolepis diminuta]